MHVKKAVNMRRTLTAAMAGILMLGVTAWAAETADANETPQVQDLQIKTYRNIPYRAGFSTTESGDQELTYTIVREPKRGSVSVEGREFIYTPKENKTGRDSFTYTATDAEGRVSREAKVTIVIEKIKSGVTYSDMGENAAAAAAQMLVEKGIFTGSRLGNDYYFEPERVVTRNEFLAMTMELAGMTVTPVTMTGFCDDAAIPVWAKAYAASGLSGGVVQGRATEDGIAFGGEEPVTFNQAAAILNRVLSVSDVDLAVWYAERDAVPSWAAQAVANMEAVCVMSVGSFGSAALNESLTRADAARMLCNASVLLEGKENTGWFA